MKKWISKFSLFILCMIIMSFLPSTNSYAKNFTIVIDPGHGGENLGGVFSNFTEKEMTMQTAMFMKNRLEQFDGVTVYLTHSNTTDKDLSLTERAQFASSVGADFLFSLHYNKSSDNRIFGSEVWVSAFDDYYVKGTQFAKIEMESLTNEGFYDRGIKTRLNSKGTDYYGIIQHSKEYGIPSVIIEHCHMDQSNDSQYLLNENAYQALGELDADCVAKYFKLKSTSLNLDYSSYELIEISSPDSVITPDKTEPEKADISLYEVDNHEATIKITASDSDSRLLYFDYSIDGGNSYSSLQKWDTSSSSLCFKLPLSKEKDETVSCRVYNLYDLYKNTNNLEIPKIEETMETETITESETETDSTELISSSDEELSTSDDNFVNTIHMSPEKHNDNFMNANIIFIIIIIFSVIFLLFSLLYFIHLSKRKNKRREKNTKHR